MVPVVSAVARFTRLWTVHTCLFALTTHHTYILYTIRHRVTPRTTRRTQALWHSFDLRIVFFVPWYTLISLTLCQCQIVLMCVGTQCVPSVATCVVAKIYRPIFFIYVFSYKLCVNFTRLCGVGAIYQAAGGGGRQRLTYANQEPTERGNATPLLGACARWPLPGLPPRAAHACSIRQRHIVWRHGDASGNSQVVHHGHRPQTRFSHGQPWAPTGTPRSYQRSS